jgi:hypothetical protein
MKHQKVAKRSACDRCKIQRLRCLRAENCTEPCLRCTRAGVECATGPARRLGRPRKVVVTDSGRFEPDQSSRRSSGNRVDQCSAASEFSSATRDVLQPVETPAMWSPRDQMPELFDNPEMAGSPVGVIDGVHDFSGSSVLWDDSHDLQLFLEELDIPEPLRSSDEMVPMNPQQSLPGCIGPENHASMCQSVGLRKGSDCFDALQSGGIRDDSDRKEEIHQLTSAARLSERITRVIARLISLFLPSLPEPCFLLMDQPDANPIAQALLCSEELIRIIKSLLSPPPSDELSTPAVSHIQSVEFGDRRESPGMPTILLLLSIYSQLRRLYDLLFSHIYRTLCIISKEIIQSTRLKLVTSFGGLPPIHDMQADTYTRIVILVMRDHLQNMDHHMGRLARYCLSKPRTPSDRLFGNNDLIPMFQRLIEQAEGHNHKAGIYHTDSLHWNIKKVLEKLGGD